jgi:hypothetical protein
MAGIRERRQARQTGPGPTAKRIRLAAGLVALLALTPLLLASLPDRAPEDPQRVALTLEGLT